MRFFTSSIVSRLGIVMMLCVGAGLYTATAAQAQGMFAPARKVNDRIITNYDVSQRIAFLELLNVGAADMRQEALSRLTEEAVQMDYARRKGLRVTSDEVSEGVAEFAARVELTAEEVLNVLAQGGVDLDSFRQFVSVGLLWRKIAEREFPGLVAVSDSDVARARDVAAIRGTTRVLISEIFLPSDPEFADAVGQIMDMIAAARSAEEFSAIAREFSLAGSRDQGGRLDWLPLENLPGNIAGPISAASPGEIIGPLELSGAFAYFQLRSRDSTRNIPADQIELTYKRLLLPGGRSEANLERVARIRAEVRSCAELGGFARDLSDDALSERTELQRNIPQSDAVELARLDRNEVSANTVEGNNLVVLMLCARELQFDDRPGTNQLRDILFDQWIGRMADVKLQELVADAEIRDY
ncbi:peptidylprolyl isomerase [Roseinatronobacter alkalisoli]|uniref:Parvulin-like PPIase n=1 Tax=Roseinatronobacter alkalisoli TaxID=3028235 RepID=A0ABT5T808_9RHOB|nr:peptidylprolyl isomerase [Roseinatronobacter sp. HJB301]MDD7971264.1 peptidylprolyl isomerase [Roseinatronobacter sp. HJB301]